MIQKLLLNTPMIYVHYVKIIYVFKLNNTIQIKTKKILIEFNDMIADMISNTKLNPMVTELFIRGKKLNISLVFIIQSYLAVPKNIRLNLTNCFVMKIPNKRELQQMAFNHSSDIDF